MISFSLQSGSNGNAIYVEAGDVRLLFDAGISARQAGLRMAARGREIRDCTALILSHEHSDHARHAAMYQKKFGLPVWMTRPTGRAIDGRFRMPVAPRWFSSGQTLEFGAVRVHTIPTPHDAVDTVCFVVEHECRRLGIFTDLGHPFAALSDALSQVDAAYLECNFDEDMLRRGPYPWWLQERIAGPAGHLSNDDAAGMARRAGRSRLQWIAAAHLSEENNTPDLALEAVRRAAGSALPVFVASRDAVSEVFEV